MTVDEARSVQFLRTHVGLTYRQLTEWWCHSKGIQLPRNIYEFGQLLTGEAEMMLGYELGAFEGMTPRDLEVV